MFLTKWFMRAGISIAVFAITAGFAASTPIAAINTLAAPANAQIWNLKNADIRAVIQTISVLTGKTFVIDPHVHGNVTLISQKPMTPDELYQVFLSMLQLLQYAAIPAGHVIKIVPAIDANALSRQVATENHPGMGDQIVVRVVPIIHVSATELVPVLRPLMSQSGSVSAYLPSNTLILAGTASNIARLVTVIKQMDTTNSAQVSVVHLRYANAKKLVAVIHALQSNNASQGVTSNATLAADTDDNSILMSANLANQLIMKNLIHELDQPGANGANTKVVTLNYLSAKKLAPILAKIAQGISTTTSTATNNKITAAADSNSTSAISVQAEVNSNAIIMRAPANIITSLLHVIRQLDVRPQEVLVEAIIVKMDENLLNQLGIVWGASNITGTNVTPTSSAPTSPDTSGTISTNNTFGFTAGLRSGIGFLPGYKLTALLHALKSNGSSDVLSTPSVVVLNNQKATISDGQNLGVANRQYQGASATTTGNAAQNIVTPFTTIQRQDVTLSLNVTPHISPNAMIRLALLQKDDSVASSSNASSTDDNPVLNTSKIKTSVLVHSGDILVLGGLMNNTEQKTQQKLPILGDLPIVGHLFRYNTNKMEKTSLMVFIRPIIMTKTSARQQTLNRYAYVRQQQIDLATQHLRQQLHLPLLPQIARKKTKLPVVMRTYLPAPTSTKTVPHRSRSTS